MRSPLLTLTIAVSPVATMALETTFRYQAGTPSGTRVPLVGITSRPRGRLAAVARTAARRRLAQRRSPGAFSARGTSCPVADADRGRSDRQRIAWEGLQQFQQLAASAGRQ